MCQFLWGPSVQYHRNSLCTYWPQKSWRLGRKPASVTLPTNIEKFEVLINFYSLFFCPFFPRVFWQVHLDFSLLTCLPVASLFPNPLHVMVSSFCAQEVVVFHVTDNYWFKRILLTFCQELNNPSLSLSYPLVLSVAGNCTNCVEQSVLTGSSAAPCKTLFNSSWKGRISAKAGPC